MTSEKKPGLTPEQKVEMTKVQREIFTNQFIKNIAIAKIGESQGEDFGNFGKQTFEMVYRESVSKAPNQLAYETLFGEAVMGEGSITKEQLKSNALKYWGGSIGFQKVSDLAKEIGYSGPIDNKYDKSLNELGENGKEISGMYMGYQLKSLMRKGIDLQMESTSKNLEGLLKPKKSEETK